MPGHEVYIRHFYVPNSLGMKSIKNEKRAFRGIFLFPWLLGGGGRVVWEGWKRTISREKLYRERKRRTFLFPYTPGLLTLESWGVGEKGPGGEFPQGQMPQFLFLWALVLKNIAISIPLLY